MQRVLCTSTFVYNAFFSESGIKINGPLRYFTGMIFKRVLVAFPFTPYSPPPSTSHLFAAKFFDSTFRSTLLPTIVSLYYNLNENVSSNNLRYSTWLILEANNFIFRSTLCCWYSSIGEETIGNRSSFDLTAIHFALNTIIRSNKFVPSRILSRLTFAKYFIESRETKRHSKWNGKWLVKERLVKAFLTRS